MFLFTVSLSEYLFKLHFSHFYRTSSSVSSADSLALVPYVPRPAFPLSVSDTLTVKHKEDEEYNSDGEVGNEESTCVESMDFAPEDSAPFSVLQSTPTFLFDSGFIFGQIDV